MCPNTLLGICMFDVWPVDFFAGRLGFPFEPPWASCQVEAQFFPQNSKFWNLGRWLHC